MSRLHPSAVAATAKSSRSDSANKPETKVPKNARKSFFTP
jgi:hypothetical protein